MLEALFRDRDKSVWKTVIVVQFFQNGTVACVDDDGSVFYTGISDIRIKRSAGGSLVVSRETTS